MREVSVTQLFTFYRNQSESSWIIPIVSWPITVIYIHTYFIDFPHRGFSFLKILGEPERD